VIVNAEATAMDDLADAVLRGSISEILPRLAEARRPRRSPREARRPAQGPTETAQYNRAGGVGRRGRRGRRSGPLRGSPAPRGGVATRGGGEAGSPPGLPPPPLPTTGPARLACRIYELAPNPALGALTSTPMFPYGCLFSSMSWWHSGMSSTPYVCDRHGSTLPSATSFVTAAAC